MNPKNTTTTTPTPTCTPDDLNAPYHHVTQLGSKGIRSMLITAIDQWTQVPPTVLEGIRQVIDILHTSSLLIDDIEDGSDLRRGAPAAHTVFGIPRTLNCANQKYFEALKLALGLPALAAASSSTPHADCEEQQAHQQYFLSNISQLTIRVANVFADEMIELHEGQGMDIYWRDTCRCPTLDEYSVMVTKKTGGLFRLALRLMMLFAAPNSVVGHQYLDNPPTAATDPPTNTAAVDILLPSSSSSSQVSDSSMFLSDDDNNKSNIPISIPRPTTATYPGDAASKNGEEECGSCTKTDERNIHQSQHQSRCDTVDNHNHNNNNNNNSVCMQLTTLVETLGVFFQVLDDLLNICSREYQACKSFFEDLSEGKFSFPIIHSLLWSSVGHTAQGDQKQRRPQNVSVPIEINEILTILKERPVCVVRKQRCVDLLNQTESLQATRTYIGLIEESIRDQIQQLGSSAPLEAVLVKMTALLPPHAVVV